MFRVILYLIGFLLLTSVIRSVLRIIGKTLQAFTSAAAPKPFSGAGRPAPPGGQLQGELKKDPICGTFISTATALQKAFGGETYYFCSAQCRDQFKG